MKPQSIIARISLGSVLAFAVAVWMSAPFQVLAQEKGAQKLMKVQTVEDVQKIEAGDTLVMYCPKCGEAYSQVIEKTFKAANPEELKTTTMHLCSSCDTKVVTEGVGKQAKQKVVHTCKMCGSEDVSCYVIKKKS